MVELEFPQMSDTTAFLVMASAVALIGSVLLLKLLCRVRETAGHVRYHWITVTGILGGCVNWTAHYAALAGLEQGFAHSFDPYLTVLVLFGSIFMMGGPVWVFGGRHWYSVEADGALIGTGVVATHHLAMAAYYVQAVPTTNYAAVVLSTLASAGRGRGKAGCSPA